MENQVNVVLIILDSLQKNYVGAYGNSQIHTPNMDTLAQESCILTNAYPESLPTLQARTAIYSGRRVFPFREKVSRKGDRSLVPGWGPIPESWKTLSEILSENDYRTGLITDTYHEFKPGKNFHRGFEQFTFIRGQEDDACFSGYLPGTKSIDDFHFKTGYDVGSLESRIESIEKERLQVHIDYLRNTALRKSEEDYFAAQVFREASKWLYQNQNAESFFLVIDSFDPHEPWDPPEYYRKLYDSDNDMDKDIILSTYSSTSLVNERELRRIKANYAGEVTLVDRWLGYFLDTLEYMDLAKHTLVILMSDHGHHLGEKSLIGKFSYPILPEVAELVCFLRFPDGSYAGKTNDEFIYNIDIAPTILSFLGIAIPENMDGIDVLPIIGGNADKRRSHVSTGWRNDIMVRTEKYWYVGRLDRSEEMLFDLINDPDFIMNLAPEKRSICKDMNSLALEDANGEIPKYVMNFPKYEVYGGLKW
jgi:arylsulfatase A-like enzyme